jgi:AcrR family transcriptional regulator
VPKSTAPATQRPKRTRLSAEERRRDLIDAAIVEFAENGYHAARTADIAERAGVSQPYVYALFPDKRALFLACHEYTTRRIRETLEQAHRDAAEGDDLHQRLGGAYAAMIESNPSQVLFQIQAYAAASADPEIQAAVRSRFVELIQTSEQLHDEPRDVVLSHIAWAMLRNLSVALDLPAEYRPNP